MLSIAKIASLVLTVGWASSGVAQTNVKNIPRVSRDVTPKGVTPGPQITAPLKRIPGVAPPPPEVKTRNLYRIRVIDTATFEGNYLGRVWRVELPEAIGLKRDETCSTLDGNDWPCGQMLTRKLQRHIRLSAFKCDFAWQSQDEPLNISCMLRGEDIQKTVLSEGWARVSKDAPDDLRRLVNKAQQKPINIYNPPEGDLSALKIWTREGSAADLPPPPDLPTADILGPLSEPQVLE
ncbi:MAG: hypothetical protein ABJO09_06130 [Hyphomicrobiales bacterium]